MSDGAEDEVTGRDKPTTGTDGLSGGVAIGTSTGEAPTPPTGPAYAKFGSIGVCGHGGNPAGGPADDEAPDLEDEGSVEMRTRFPLALPLRDLAELSTSVVSGAPPSSSASSWGAPRFRTLISLRILILMP